MHRHLEAVIFDWAGTTVDFGVLSQAQIYVDAFKAACDMEISLEQASVPTGLGPWQHIESLGTNPTIDACWRARFGHSMGYTETRHIYETFVPLQIERAGLYSALIPGVLDVVSDIRKRGLKVGSTSSYPRQVMLRMIDLVAQQGYEPDCTVCSDDLKTGSRPGPWMALDCLRQLHVGAVSHCVKVDDTQSGIEEGLNAGMWTVGVALSSRSAGWSLEEFRKSDDVTRERVRERVSAELRAAGAHFVIDTVADLIPIIDEIQVHLADGQKP